jgi:hypothetical protein
MKQNMNLTPEKMGKLVVVLGMHRSGTSATTRAMSALGANFGNRLLPPLPGVNEKGFFEDVDILRINAELMGAAGKEWHSVGEIELNRVPPAQLEAFRAHAIATLRAKCQEGTTFAVKDPRMARLMPFWQPLFEEIGLSVVYAVTVRNPISVMRSLKKRDGLGEEKAYLLWLTHVVPALLDTRGCVRVIVDYDRLLDNPRGELKRMAVRLGLPLEAKRVEEFGREFLEEGLRHTRFHARDLDVVRSAPHSLKKLFQALDELCRTDATEDTIDEPLELARQYLEDLAPLLRDEMVVHKTIVKHNAAFAQRNKQIEEAKTLLAQRDELIAGLERLLKQRQSLRTA